MADSEQVNNNDYPPQLKNIIVIEDHSIVRSALFDYFNKKEYFRVIGTSDNIKDAKNLFKSNVLDIIILDLELKDGLGITLIPYIKEMFKIKPIIAVYTAYGDFVHVSAAMGKGVDVYMLKYRSVEELEQAIMKALNGEKYIDDLVQSKLELQSNIEETLTRREKEIFVMVKNGKTNKQIALSLGIKKRTVENILQCIFDKLGIHSRSELIEL
ncbi:MAG: response regulator transcription factor [Treponema sp.]|nr:response regulator transcription factor [Treponema sp.]MCL2251371.1 response regulator transcription factor [Treponema sp.]